MIIVYYLIIITTLSLILMGYDKYSSIKNKRRISQRIFMVISILGGFIGIGLGMMFFNHKINKLKFYIIILISILLWGFIIYRIEGN